MVSLPSVTRLFYIGTWNFALCDQGHLPDDAGGLKLKILPAEQVDGVALVNELIAAGRLQRIEITDGRSFLWIPKFSEWQTADTRNKPRCPVCRDASKPSETHMGFEENSREHANPSQRGGEGKGSESRGGEAPPRRCPKHIEDPDPPPCGACKEARLKADAWDQAHEPGTSIPTREPVECAMHPGYPPGRACTRCQEGEA